MFNFDIRGLFAWPWEDVEDLVSTECVPEGQLGINVLGLTIAYISVESVSCSCSVERGFRRWRYKSARVKLHINVLLYDDSIYMRFGVNPEWVKRAEQDHVNDFQRWAETEGDDIVEDFICNIVFDTESDCLSEVSGSLRKQLDESLKNANKESRRKWDYSGLHTYEGTNKTA